MAFLLEWEANEQTWKKYRPGWVSSALRDTDGSGMVQFLFCHLCFTKTSTTWASLVAQSVKNLPEMQETRVQFLSQEDPLEKGKATHSSILA